MFKTYAPSGKFDGRAVLLVAACAAAGIALAWVYQRLVDWIPLIYLNLLATIGFGTLLGILVSRSLVVGRARSPHLATVGAVFVPLIAVAASFHWAYRIAVPQIHEEVAKYAKAQGGEAISLEEFEQRFTFVDWAEARVDSGWTVGRVTSNAESKPAISGAFVYVIWAIEAAMITFLCWKVARPTANKPFCETCERWTETESVGAWESVDAKALREAATRGDVETLLRPVPAAVTSPSFGVYSLEVCDECKKTTYLDVQIHTPQQDKKGKVTTKAEPVVTSLEVTPEQRDAIRAYRYPAPPAPATA